MGEKERGEDRRNTKSDGRGKVRGGEREGSRRV